MTNACHFTPEGKKTLARFIADHMWPRLDDLARRRADPLDVAGLMPARPSYLAGNPLP